jgi:predicted nucleotidyltransferase
MGTVATPFVGLLFGQTRGRILGLLLGKPDEAFYVREIARSVGTSVGSVQRELKTLAGSGLLSRSETGNMVFYRANREHPVYPEMHSLVAKTVGIYALLSSALEPLASRIAFAFVYGSLARGDENAGSDVDLMIVGEVTLDEVLDCLTPVENEIGRSINPNVYSRAEFQSKMASNNPFLKSVMPGEKVVLLGGTDELGKVG